MPQIEIKEPKISRFIFSDTRFALVWLVIRLYLGYEWILSGFDKLGKNGVLLGRVSEDTVQNFAMGLSQKTEGLNPSINVWYMSFIQHFIVTHATLFAYLTAYGEIIIGVALILGMFAGIAAFFGTFLNFNYLFVGTLIINPVVLFLQILIILAWRTAGWYGIDRYIFPYFGVPWDLGEGLKQTEEGAQLK